MKSDDMKSKNYSISRKRKKKIEGEDVEGNNKKKSKLKNKVKNKRDFSTRQNKTQSPEEKPQPTYKEGDVVNLSELLFTKQRDFLVTYKDRDCPVQAKQLEGKVIVLHFLPLVPWSSFGMRHDTTILLDVYHHLQPKGGFEVVFIGVAVDNVRASNPDELSVIFPLSCFLYSKNSTSVVIVPTGRVSQCDAWHIFYWWGAQAYPFTDERISYLESEDEEALKHPSITELLASPERNHLINNKNQVIPLPNLEDKVVGLYFVEVCNPPPLLKTAIQSDYESLAQEKNFEIVLVYIHDAFLTFEFSSEESYWESFKTMPWLALPYKDPACKRLQRLFRYPMDGWEMGPDPSLMIISPREKYVERYGADILMKFGISAYPFTRYSVVKSEVEFIQKVNLNMFWRQDTCFLQKDGSTVEFSQLVGKNIILVENDRYRPDAKFWRMLRIRYLQMKGTDDEFEVIHICKSRKRYSYGKNVATMSWLRHPSGHVLGSKGCNARACVSNVFEGVLGLFAFDRDGRIVRRNSIPSIERRYVGFPFGDMEKELLRKVVQKFEWYY